MTDERARLPLPRSGFKLATATDKGAAEAPAVVTPNYGDRDLGAGPSPAGVAPPSSSSTATRVSRRSLDPFDAYGDRTASRPFALRLPEPIDLALRQIAAERHTQPLRVVDQALHDYLVKLGRLPAAPDA